MKLRIMSDLHLEFFRGSKKIWFPPPMDDDHSSILVLAGDLSTNDLIFKQIKDIPEWAGLAADHVSWIGLVSMWFKHVVFVYGNHDFWGSTLDGTIDRVRDLCKGRDNVHFLEKDSVVIEGINFVGGTLWTDLNKCDPFVTWSWKEDMKNDAKRIRIKQRGYKKWSAPELIAYHNETKRFIFNEVAKKLPTVVVTHHSPSYLGNVRDPNNRYVHYYHSELGNEICQHDNIKLWVHGHTHDNVDYEIGSTRIVANMLGYHGEVVEQDFDPYFTVEV